LTGLARDMGGQEEGELLDPEVAFFHTLEVEPGEQALIARWQVADNYYLYRDKFEFELRGADNVSLGEPEFPQGKMKDDAFFGLMEVYVGEVAIRLPLNRPAEAVEGLTLAAKSQGCAEIGVCYPPIIRETSFDLRAAAATGTPAAVAAAPAAGASFGDMDFGSVDSIMQVLTGGSLGLMLGISLVLGVLIAFTACMYPMIPILSSLIVGQGEKMTARRGFLFSLVYVEAMAVTFGLMGAIMAVIGAGVGIQAYFQSPALLIPFAILFVLLAMGMFGFYNLQVPSFIQSRLNAISNKQKGGSLIGVAIMGALSALIIGPCGGPVLVAELAYAGASESVVKGFLALFVFGNGMGLPLLLVGVTGGKLLPRAGTWMNAVKAVAGVILLAVGIVMLERMPGIFPVGLTMTLWALLFIVGGVFMGALEPIKEGVSGWWRFWKAIGLVFVFYGFVVFLGGMTGGSSVTDPLHGSRLLGGGTVMMAPGGEGQPQAGAPQAKLQFKTIKTLDDFHTEVDKASAAGKTVMLDFYADWCTYCKQFEKYVFSDPGVRAALSDTVLLKADVTATDRADRELMEALGVFLPPAILFIGADGEERRDQRVVGHMEADRFQARIQQAFGSN
ncbi:MAG TPA: protein-disulfide reductase DsbD, partial [Thioalkalivibrio sp.]|nr:protein-disulfide reductase DsbD [Thioalkalivibrio sp.]